jgi:hypothetical protein
MRRAYRKGLIVALHRWPLVGVLFVISLLGGGTFMACAWVGLVIVLDGSLATRTLLTSLDINVFVDILVHHGAAVEILGVVALALATFWSFVWIWMNAAVATAVTGEREALRDSFSGAAGKYWTFVRMWTAAMAGHAVIILVAYVVRRLLAHWAASSTNEMTPYWILAACLLSAALALLTVTTIHDHARIRCVETADGAGRCMAWAASYVLRQPRTVGLTLLLVVTLGLVWMPYQAVAELIPATSALGLTASLIWAEVFMVLRGLVRVWGFAAAAALQASVEDA